MTAGQSGLLLLLLTGVHWFGDAGEVKVDLLIPDELSRCMDQARSENKEIQIIFGGNPFYLRGDFDGDDRADYVTMVIPSELKSASCHECRGELSCKCTGVLFCFSSGATDVLGAEVGALPMGVDPEYFLGSHWEVLSTTEPYVEPLGADGEVVVMSWEDAWGILYLQNGRYKWKFKWTMPGLGEDLETGSGEGE